jgi:uncharacterized membrane protein
MTAVPARVGGALGDRRVLGAVVATAVFLGSWVLLDHWFFADGRIVDTPIYQGYGLAMRNGEVPYRDFSVEYPPGALPAFLVPTYFGEPTWIVDYERWFARLMAVCGIAVLLFVLLARPPRHGVVLMAVSPLLAGALILSRFDLWPAALVAASVAAFVRDRHRLGWLALGLAFSVKLYAVVLVPLAVVWTLRRRGRDELGRGIAIWVVAVAAVFAPFAMVAPHGLWESLWGQLSRPVQVESLAASLLTTFGSPHDYVSHHAVAISGYGWLETLTTLVEVGVLAALWIGFSRGPAEPQRFVRYAAACVCAFVAFGKVLSPQYLIWLVPLVALVSGRRGLAAAALLGAAMIETQYWFAAPRYRAYINGYGHAPLVLVRNLLLVGLLVVLAAPLRQRSRAR